MDNSGMKVSPKVLPLPGASRQRKRRMYAENDTEPGAVDDDATERIKKRKKMLEDAAG